MRLLGARHSLLYGNIFSQDIEHSADVSCEMSLWYDENEKVLVCGTGRNLEDVHKFAKSNSRMIEGMPMIGKITVGGAISVGAHGGGVVYPTLSSQISYMFIIDKDNVMKKVTSEKDLKVLRVCFGLCGNIMKVGFHTKPFSHFEFTRRKINMQDI